MKKVIVAGIIFVLTLAGCSNSDDSVDDLSDNSADTSTNQDNLIFETDGTDVGGSDIVDEGLTTKYKLYDLSTPEDGYVTTDDEFRVEYIVSNETGQDLSLERGILDVGTILPDEKLETEGDIKDIEMTRENDEYQWYDLSPIVLKDGESFNFAYEGVVAQMNKKIAGLSFRDIKNVNGEDIGSTNFSEFNDPTDIIMENGKGSTN